MMLRISLEVVIQVKLQPNEKINIEEILNDLEHYTPRRKGWTWRKKLPEGTKKSDFNYYEISEDLKNSVPTSCSSLL